MSTTQARRALSARRASLVIRVRRAPRDLAGPSGQLALSVRRALREFRARRARRARKARRGFSARRALRDPRERTAFAARRVPSAARVLRDRAAQHIRALALLALWAPLGRPASWALPARKARRDLRAEHPGLPSRSRTWSPKPRASTRVPQPDSSATARNCIRTRTSLSPASLRRSTASRTSGLLTTTRLKLVRMCSRSASTAQGAFLGDRGSFQLHAPNFRPPPA